MWLAIVDDNTTELHMTETLEDSFLLSAASNSYDVVFLDIYLEEANGLDLAASFRRLSPKTPIVFLTSSPEYHADALHVHAFDYLEKPITKAAIYQLLHDLLDIRPISEDDRFLKINRGVMVNLDYVSSMEGVICTMNDGTTFSMNKKQAGTLQQAYITRQFMQRSKSLLHGGLS